MNVRIAVHSTDHSKEWHLKAAEECKHGGIEKNSAGLLCTYEVIADDIIC